MLNYNPNSKMIIPPTGHQRAIGDWALIDEGFVFKEMGLWSYLLGRVSVMFGTVSAF